MEMKEITFKHLFCFICYLERIYEPNTDMLVLGEIDKRNHNSRLVKAIYFPSKKIYIKIDFPLTENKLAKYIADIEVSKTINPST